MYLVFFKGGWNNNPNASQFKYIFRRLMAQCGVVTCRGNVTAQDDTQYLPADINTSTSLAAVDMSSAVGGGAGAGRRHSFTHK